MKNWWIKPVNKFRVALLKLEAWLKITKEDIIGDLERSHAVSKEDLKVNVSLIREVMNKHYIDSAHYWKVTMADWETIGEKYAELTGEIYEPSSNVVNLMFHEAHGALRDREFSGVVTAAELILKHYPDNEAAKKLKFRAELYET